MSKEFFIVELMRKLWEEKCGLIRLSFVSLLGEIERELKRNEITGRMKWKSVNLISIAYFFKYLHNFILIYHFEWNLILFIVIKTRRTSTSIKNKNNQSPPLILTTFLLIVMKKLKYSRTNQSKKNHKMMSHLTKSKNKKIKYYSILF